VTGVTAVLGYHAPGNDAVAGLEMRGETAGDAEADDAAAPLARRLFECSLEVKMPGAAEDSNAGTGDYACLKRKPRHCNEVRISQLTQL
jgi:hypothetical protein